LLSRQRDQEIFDCEVICKWTESYQIIPLINITQKVGLFQAQDQNKRLWTWICFRHHGTLMEDEEHHDKIDEEISNDPQAFEGDVELE
jgi:hypothetical protein